MSVAGPQKLTAIFTPDDTANYTSAPASVTLSVLPYGLVAWGDSLTAGNEGIADTGIYPTELQSLTLLPVVNEGVGGNTSTQIGVRQGSVPTYASVAGGLIPASGGVAVSFPTGFEPVTAGGPATGVQGSILGVHGNVTYANGIYTFTPTVTGTPVSAPGSPRLIVDTPYASYLPVFWEGRNNFMHASQVLSDLAAQVATVPAGQNYLVLSVINMDSPLEQKGGYGYNQILALNQQLGSVYGEHYLDVRKILVDSYNPLLITDVSDFNNDEPPTSLRAILDNGSLTNAIGASDTSFAVHLTGYNLATGEILTVDTGANAENVLITALSGNTVTVTRNLGGNNTAHAAGSNVTGTDAVHLNAQGDQIVAHAVANYLAATQPAGQASKP
jgi:hypothetical protein